MRSTLATRYRELWRVLSAAGRGDAARGHSGSKQQSPDSRVRALPAHLDWSVHLDALLTS